MKVKNIYISNASEKEETSHIPRCYNKRWTDLLTPSIFLKKSNNTNSLISEETKKNQTTWQENLKLNNQIKMPSSNNTDSKTNFTKDSVQKINTHDYKKVHFKKRANLNLSN